MNSKNIFPPSTAANDQDGSSLNGRGRAHWTEDMYLPLSPQRLQLSAKLPPRRWGTALIAIASVFILLLSRSYILQVNRGEEYRAKAATNRIATKVIKANRGLIYDKNLVPLVKNIPRFSLLVQQNLLPKKKEDRKIIVDQINKIIPLPDITKEKIVDLIKDYQPFVAVASLPQDQAYNFFAQKDKFPAFTVSVTSIRSYPFDAGLAHILGYIGRLNEIDLQQHPDYYMDDFIGKTGLEAEYEDLLRGTYGKSLYEVDASLREQKLLQQVDQKIGTSLVLGIDEQLQQKLSDNLREALLSTKSPGAAAVAIDPRDGSILALVSEPGFLSADFQSGISDDAYNILTSDKRKPLFNRATTGEYPSGSTIKPFVALAALESGVITPSFTVNSTGGIHIGQYFYPDWKNGGHGITDVRHAIANSVNTFFYIIGGGDNDKFAGLGVTRLNQYLDKYGFGKATGIDLPAESDGFIPSPEWRKKVKNENWYLGDTYHFAIGQGDLLVTPIQLANSLAAIANGGTLYQPHLGIAHYDESTREQKKIVPKIVLQKIAEEKNIRVIREGMRLTVTDGTAKQLQSLPVATAAKTGTAQFGSGEKTHALFEVFAPYDKPTIALIILVEEGGQGSSIGQQIANKVLSWYFNK